MDERVIPRKTETTNLMRHIARYNVALMHARGKVLDAGCGVGYGTHILGFSRDVTEVKGCDISLEAINEARDSYASTFFLHDLTEPLSEKFDTIVCFEVLEHIKDIEKALGSIKEALLGKLIVSLPLYEPDGFNPHHKRTFTLEQAKILFKDFKSMGWTIQTGVNFNPVDERKQFTQFIGFYENS